MHATDMTKIFTDGACKGNPGPGGWAFLIQEKGGGERSQSGHEADTTNNRMEMMAVLSALESLGDAGQTVAVYSDSRYVIDGITLWMENWRKRYWRTAEGKAVKNVDLWKRLEAAAKPHTIAWYWVRGHGGHPENERVDALARNASLGL